MSRLKTIAAAAALTGVAAIAALPTLVSTGVGKRGAVGVANFIVDGDVQVDHLQLGWLSGQEIRGLRVTQEGREIFAVDELSTEATLLGLATGSKQIGTTRIIHPRALVADSGKGGSGGGGSAADADPKPLELPFLGELEIESGEVTIERAGHEPVVITDLNASVKATEMEGPLEGKITGVTKQGGVSGNILVDGTIDGFDDSGKLALARDDRGLPILGEKARLNLNVDVTRLPMATVSGPLAEALGDAIDIQIQNRLDTQGLVVSTIINAPNLRAQINGRTREGQFELAEPAEATLTLSPSYLESLGAGLRFNKPVQARASIDRLAFPLDVAAMRFDMTALQLLADVSVDDISMVSEGTSLLTELVNVQSRVEVRDPKEGIRLSGGADLYHNRKSGKLSLDATLHHLLEATGPFGATLNLEGSGVPIGIADRLIGFDGLIEDAIGSTLNLSMAGEVLAERADLRVSLDSPALRVNDLRLQRHNRLTISSSTPLQVNLQPSFMERFFVLEPSVALRESVPLRITLNRVDLPADGFVPSDSNVDVKVTLDQATLYGLEGVGDVRARNGLVTLKGTLDQAQLHQEIDLDLLSGGAITNALGSSVNTTADSTLHVKEDFGMDLLSMVCHVKAPQTEGLLRGKLVDRTRLTVTSAELDQTITPQAFIALLPREAGKTTLQKPATFNLQVDPFELVLDELDTNTLTLSGRATVDEFAVGKTQNTIASVQEGSFDWDLNVPKGSMTSNINARTLAEGQRGSLAGTITIDNWQQEGMLDVETAHAIAQLNFSRFPVPFLEALSGYDDLDTLIGQSLELTLDLDVRRPMDPIGRMQVDANGNNFSANLDLGFDNGITLFQGKPAAIDWTISPTRFVALRELAGSEHPIRLLKDADVRLAIDELALPWGEVNRQIAAADVTVTISELVLEDQKNKTRTSFQDFKARLKGEDLTQLLDFSILGSGSLGNKQSIQLSVNGELEQPLKQDGSVNWETMGKKVDATATNIPASLVADSFGAGRELTEQVRALFGDRLDVEASADIRNGSGPLSATLTAEHSRFNFDGQLDNQILSLRQPLTAELEVTPDLSRTVLKNINPLLVTAVDAERPISLRVDPHSVRVPMDTWDTSQLQIGKATLDIGKVTLTNGGPLALIIGILQSGSLAGRDRMQAWFTPQYIHVRNGILEAERMDFLIADNIHMAAWGNVDLPQNKIKMTLGIPSHTLRQNFGIKDVPSDHMMKVPIKGSLEDPDINVASAIARIAAMRASQFSGKEGKILGDIFGIIGGGGQIADGPAPPPTTDPLPWPVPKFDDDQPQQPQEEEPQQEEEDRFPFPFPRDDGDGEDRPRLPNIFDIFK